MSTASPKPSPRRVTSGFTIERLMRYSERRLELAAQSGAPNEAHVATRILQEVPLFRQWEFSHAQLMQPVAVASARSARVVELRRVALGTLHRKAPFEYLRDRHLTGDARRLSVRSLFGTQQYTHCVLREHVAFLSSSGSLLCADSLCSEVHGDARFAAALPQYERAYTEFYRAYGDTLLAELRGEPTPLKRLLPYLRFHLKLIREHIVAGAPATSEYAALLELYDRSGDTQELPTLPRP